MREDTGARGREAVNIKSDCFRLVTAMNSRTFKDRNVLDIYSSVDFTNDNGRQRRS